MRKKFTTAPDGTSVSRGTQLVRKEDGKRFEIDSIVKQSGKGRFGQVTIVAKGHGETLNLTRQELADFDVNLSTVYGSQHDYYAHPDEDPLAEYSW